MILATGLGVAIKRSEPTYEGLKGRVEVTEAQAAEGSEPTYEGLKGYMDQTGMGEMPVFGAYL